MKEKSRCVWANPENPLYVAYHDQEWGVPSHDDRHLFEMLILEGAQAGLSWETILAKRENYRRAFDRFDPLKISRYTDAKIQKLLADPGIVRNRLKIHSVVSNAKIYLEVKKEFGSFDRYIWSFAGGSSEAMSKALKKRGFRFVGGTICYAYMQAIGMVNDHSKNCFRRKQLS